MQSSVSVNKILARMVERVRNTLSATHVIVHQGTMVPCVKMVSKITKQVRGSTIIQCVGANSYVSVNLRNAGVA